jgi:hypothetical protein
MHLTRRGAYIGACSTLAFALLIGGLPLLAVAAAYIAAWTLAGYLLNRLFPPP